eukprot:2122388-Pleurochrysis_carterae.AAC.2
MELLFRTESRETIPVSSLLEWQGALPSPRDDGPSGSVNGQSRAIIGHHWSTTARHPSSYIYYITERGPPVYSPTRKVAKVDEVERSAWSQCCATRRAHARGEAVGVCEDEGLGADGDDDAEKHAGEDEGDEARQRDGRAEGTGADACGGGSVIRVGQGLGDGLYGAFVAGAALEL